MERVIQRLGRAGERAPGITELLAQRSTSSSRRCGAVGAGLRAVVLAAELPTMVESQVARRFYRAKMSRSGSTGICHCRQKQNEGSRATRSLGVMVGSGRLITAAAPRFSVHLLYGYWVSCNALNDKVVTRSLLKHRQAGRAVTPSHPTGSGEDGDAGAECGEGRIR